MNGKVKFGVYIPDDLAHEIDEYLEESRLRSKSRLIQEALRLFLAEHAWQAKGRVAGIIGVVYNHHAPMIDTRLTDVQHEYIDVIVSTLHVHLTREYCMLAIVVRGDTRRIKELIARIINLNGVLNVRQILLAADEKHHKRGDSHEHIH